MVAQLSDLLRMTLANIGVQEVPLQQELEFLRRYLDIQQMRFQDRLRVVVDVPADTLDIQVPNQVLQPLVENAIRHGVDARRGEGLIEIRARAEGAMLQLSVRDDGPGLRPDAVNGAVRRDAASACSNTRARLRELYGPVSTLELANHPAGRHARLAVDSAATGAARAASCRHAGGISRTARTERGAMIRTLIVDDEPLARERLRTLLQHEPDIEVIGEVRRRHAGRDGDRPSTRPTSCSSTSRCRRSTASACCRR